MQDLQKDQASDSLLSLKQIQAFKQKRRMKSFAVLFVAFAAAQAGFVPFPATTLFRAPSHDSAIIQSDRLGGNFAYSVQESHAFAAVSPVITNVRTPVGVSYSTPAVFANAAPIAPFPAVALEAPKADIKTVELPKIELPQIQLKAIEVPKVEIQTVPAAPVAYTAGLPLTYSGLPLSYTGLPWTHGAAPLSLVEVKAEEKRSE